MRIGLVGSGGMAAQRLSSFVEFDGCEVTALAARNQDTGQRLAEQHNVPLLADWEDLVTRHDVDAVVICSNNDSHAAIALSALGEGKPVFMEYPLARNLEDARRIVTIAQARNLPVRVAHEEVFSASHVWLREHVLSFGQLHLAEFRRVTPGRGARPEKLLNLHVSGPPMLFFVYHIYPLVDLFGPVAWVDGHATYIDLDSSSGCYKSFVNLLTAGFSSGGTAFWSWAGGVNVSRVDQSLRLIFSDGTLNSGPDCWEYSTREASDSMMLPQVKHESLVGLFLDEVQGKSQAWQADLNTAYHAVCVSLFGEHSASEGCRLTVH